MTATRKLFFSALFISSLSGAALAMDGYPAALQNQFTGWCTGQSYSAQVCGCAASQAAVQIPAVAMTSFLAASEGQGTAALSTSVGISAVQIITTCAATSSGSGSGASDAMNALGGLLGN